MIITLLSWIQGDDVFGQGRNISVVRSYIDFDINHIVDDADEIDQAYLYLFFNNTRGYIEPFGEGHQGENAFLISRITSPWEEMEVTWNTQPGVDNSVNVLAPKSLTRTEDYKIDVTQLVKNMINNPDNSYGFALSLVEEAPYRAAVFASSDHSNSELWPKLEIIKK